MLSVEGVSVRFDGARALQRVSLSAGPGECLGLIGPNGAGKTTLFNAIGGSVHADAGRIALYGRSLTGLAPEEIALAGVGRTFQSPRLFTRMTVEENVRSGRAVDVGRWLRWAGLAARRDQMVGALTPADGRRLELARALAAGPDLLLLDEPCGGLNPAETEAMVALLRDAAAPDRITILVEHKLGVVDRLCQRVVVLHLGEKIFDGPVQALRGNPRVIEAYLGAAPTI